MLEFTKEKLLILSFLMPNKNFPKSKNKNYKILNSLMINDYLPTNFIIQRYESIRRKKFQR